MKKKMIDQYKYLKKIFLSLNIEIVIQTTNIIKKIINDAHQIYKLYYDNIYIGANKNKANNNRTS